MVETGVRFDDASNANEFLSLFILSTIAYFLFYVYLMLVWNNDVIIQLPLPPSSFCSPSNYINKNWLDFSLQGEFSLVGYLMIFSHLLWYVILWGLILGVKMIIALPRCAFWEIGVKIRWKLIKFKCQLFGILKLIQFYFYLFFTDGFPNFQSSFPEWCEDERTHNMQSNSTEQLMGLR